MDRMAKDFVREEIQSYAGGMEQTLRELCPESRELSLALTKLEEAMMWAMACIEKQE